MFSKNFMIQGSALRHYNKQIMLNYKRRILQMIFQKIVASWTTPGIAWSHALHTHSYLWKLTAVFGTIRLFVASHAQTDIELFSLSIFPRTTYLFTWGHKYRDVGRSLDRKSLGCRETARARSANSAAALLLKKTSGALQNRASTNRMNECHTEAD